MDAPGRGHPVTIGDFHGIALLAVFPLGVVPLYFFAALPKAPNQGALSLVLLLVGFVAALLGIYFNSRIPMCGPSPSLQVLLPAGIAAFWAATGKTWSLRVGLFLVFIVIGVGLSRHYLNLVYGHSDEYAGLEDGHPVITCTAPVEARMLWHSRFTGVIRIEPASR